MIEAGSVALGMLVSLIGWGIFIFVVFLPRIKRLTQYIEAKEAAYMTLIEEKEKKYMKKIDDVLEGKDKKFNTIIEDISPQIVGKIKEEMPDITNELIHKFTGPPTPEMIEALGNISQFIFNYAMENPEMKLKAQGWINGKLNGVVNQLESRIGFGEQDIKDLRELIAFFNANKDKLNMLAGGGQGGGQGGGFDPMQMLMGFAQGQQ